MSQLHGISKYIVQNTRNRIVFTDFIIDELEFVNVGISVAQALTQCRESNPSDIVADVLSKTIANPTIGNYLALDNIGILFEPELKLDVRSLLDSYSKNQTLIIRTDAMIVDNTFHFLCPNDNVSIDLSGLSFKIIKHHDNI